MSTCKLLSHSVCPLAVYCPTACVHFQTTVSQCVSTSKLLSHSLCPLANYCPTECVHFQPSGPKSACASGLSKAKYGRRETNVTPSYPIQKTKYFIHQITGNYQYPLAHESITKLSYSTISYSINPYITAATKPFSRTCSHTSSNFV